MCGSTSELTFVSLRHRTKNVCCLNDVIKKVTDWRRKYSQCTYITKDTYLEYIKNSHNSVRRRKRPNKKRQKILTEITQRRYAQEKMLNIISPERNVNKTQNEVLPHNHGFD